MVHTFRNITNCRHCGDKPRLLRRTELLI